MIKKTVYLSGPISGRSRLDVASRFRAAAVDVAHRLDERGERAQIVSPADMSGWGLSWITYMDLAKRILRSGEIDVIYMMAGWEDSEGAKIEHWIAEQEGIEILYEEAESAKHAQKLKDRSERPYDAMGDDQGRGYTGDEAYRRDFVEKYDDQEEE